MTHPRSLHHAISRWEAESVARRNFCGLPYSMEDFVAGFLVGTTDGAELETDARHSSLRAGFRCGRDALAMWARDQGVARG